jgi:PPK2 family polyphosphate:nucleotide phosphotransferase
MGAACAAPRHRAARIAWSLEPMNTDRFRVPSGKRVSLEKHDPADSAPFGDRAEANGLLEKEVGRICGLQERLYAENQWSLLLIFQAPDGAGKDSTIAHVLSGLNPQGAQTKSFKGPSSEELSHDFLWRCYKALPERGKIGIFNRSHYEEVLVVRVQPEFLAGQRIPASLITKRIWQERYEDINAMERHLARNGTVIRKFYLNVSKGEQKKRFLERIDDASKNWKFAAEDLDKRKQWKVYRKAYEEMLAETSTSWAPWYVIPADRKWFTRIAVAQIVRETLESINPKYPAVSPAQRAALQKSKQALLHE